MREGVGCCRNGRLFPVDNVFRKAGIVLFAYRACSCVGIIAVLGEVWYKVGNICG